MVFSSRQSSLWVVVPFVFTLVFAPVAQAKKATAVQCKDISERLYNKAVSLIDDLEQKNPKDQAILFKLKATINALYRYNKENAETMFAQLSSEVMQARNPDGAGDLYAGSEKLRDEELIRFLKNIMCKQVPVGYQGAQSIVFEKLDNHDGMVECVYTGRKLATHGEPNATNMNIEHTWPQSQGAVGDAKCDLHHLFPTDSKANGIRSSFPYGNVSSVKWEEGGSRFDGSKFEVRKQQRGDTARAKFYFAVRYDKKIPDSEEKVLRGWAKEDPIDASEKDRNNSIENFQHNRNAFVDHPEFVDAISDF